MSLTASVFAILLNEMNIIEFKYVNQGPKHCRNLHERAIVILVDQSEMN